MHLSKFKFLLTSLLVGTLFIQGCGWHLRGSQPLPAELKTLNLQTASQNSKFSRALKRAFKTMDVNLTDSISDAPYTLSVSNIHDDRRVLSTTGTAKVAEYVLTSAITYSVKDSSGEKLAGPSVITTEKTYLYNRDNAVSSFEEEKLIREEMQRDLIQQLIRRYRALKPATGTETE